MSAWSELIQAVFESFKKYGLKLTWCKLFHNFKRAEFSFKSIKPEWFYAGKNYDYIATYNVKCNCGCEYDYRVCLLGNNDIVNFGCNTLREATEKAKSQTRMQIVGK